jgi:PQQ-dependent catabolism-associated CXXCW motif protein
MPAKSADALPDAMPANPPGVAPVATVTMPADSAPVLPQSRGTGTPATPPAAVPLTTSTNAPDAALVTTRSTLYYGNENVDFKVRPQNQLKYDVGTRTPRTIPGASTVTTAELMEAMQHGQPMVLIDALQDGHSETIKGAVSLPYAGAYGDGTFHDQVQAQLTKALNGLVQGRERVPLVFFCQGVRCWESYNAALRARAAGFQNISWYRGGLNAWKQAGLPLQPRD